VTDLKANKKLVLALLVILLIFISVLYPSGLSVHGTKPDLILVFIIMAALLFDTATMIYTALFAAFARDLIEFRFPGPYILTYAVIIILIYFLGSFFYKPGLMINLLFVAVFTFVNDILWITFHNVYYILSYGINTNFSYAYNIVNGTIYQIIQNILAGVVFYYLTTYIKRRVLNEKV
jgi:hypothetical protein